LKYIEPQAAAPVVPQANPAALAAVPVEPVVVPVESGVVPIEPVAVPVVPPGAPVAPVYRTRHEEWERGCESHIQGMAARYISEQSAILRKAAHQKRVQDKEVTIEALAQAHLRKVNYELDPLASFMSSNAASMAYYASKPEPIPQFTEAKKHFFSQIFQEAYGKSDVEGKRRIIAQLAPFQPQLESRSFKNQRLMFKIESVFIRITKNPYAKAGLCVVIGVGSYLAINKLIPLAGQFFHSATFISLSSVVSSRMPVVIIQISSGIHDRVIGLVAYVAGTRLYWYMFESGTIVPLVICWMQPTMRWVYYPATTIANKIVMFVYARSFGPSARAQQAISESLESLRDRAEAHELLEGGMKAYQVWIDLVERGSQEGLFQEAVAN
jgi:hypothetical protein